MATVKKTTVKKIKKAQYGESVSMDRSGKTQIVTKTNTKDGPRYYKSSGPESSARARNNFLAKTNSSDSTRAKDLDPIDLKKLSSMKNGGKTPAWTRSEGKDPKGGLNRKGVASYRRANPGSKLKMAVTTKPSKLKPGSKAAGRRKSFCARMSGVKGPAKKPNGEPTRKTLALRKWNC